MSHFDQLPSFDSIPFTLKHQYMSSVSNISLSSSLLLLMWDLNFTTTAVPGLPYPSKIPWSESKLNSGSFFIKYALYFALDFVVLVSLKLTHPTWSIYVVFITIVSSIAGSSTIISHYILYFYPFSPIKIKSYLFFFSGFIGLYFNFKKFISYLPMFKHDFYSWAMHVKVKNLDISGGDFISLIKKSSYPGI